MLDTNAALQHAWRFDLGTYSNKIDEGWLPYGHLRHAIDRVQNKILEGNARIIINMPPRYGKSETFSGKLPTWFLDWYPEKRVILTSYEATIASDWGRVVRDNFADNDMTNTCVRDDVRAVNRWHTTEGGGMITAGVGGPITGKGGDLIIVDDPHKNYKEAVSKAKQKEIFEWWRTTLATRLEPNGSIVVIMTRWCDNDLTSWLQANTEDDWEMIVLPEIAEENDQMGREVGELLCPERFDQDQVDKKKGLMGTRAHTGMCQQRPSPEGGTIFQRKHLQFYDVRPTSFDKIVQSWDCAFKGGDDNDYVCGQVWGQIGADKYLLDQFHDKANFSATQNAIMAMSMQWPTTSAIYIEDKANGPAIINTLKNKIGRLIAVDPEGGKIVRARAVEPQFESGNIFLPNAKLCTWIGDYIEELLSFPNAPHDDRVDATTQALVKLGTVFHLMIGRA
jgi:predicted phage terminase large subunit-like protein